MEYWIFNKSEIRFIAGLMVDKLLSLPNNVEVSVMDLFEQALDVSENQLQFTAVAISNRYRWLKAGELMLFFFNFKAGFSERFYSHFDTQTIIRSFKSFLEERALAIAAHERNT